MPIGQVADRPARPLRMGVFVGAPTGTPVNAEVQKAVDMIARAERPVIVERLAASIYKQGELRVWTGRLGMHWGFERSKVEPWTKGLMGFFSREKLAGLAATRRLRRFSSTFAQVMERHDVLISPTLAEPAPSLGYLAPDLPFNTAFERIRAYAAFTTFYNVSGAPAITLPLGRSSAGLPIGVQFAAAHGSDRALLELALSIEAAQPWPGVAPREAWVSTATRASH